MNSRHSPGHTAHTAHDPLLIARLFGDDLGDAERSEALEWLGECAECQALYADLGDDATAIRSLPVPARPRDFTLTPADAARLRGGRPSLRGLGTWARPLGTLLSGVGAAALALLIVGSQFGAGSSSVNTTQERGAAALPQASAAASAASAAALPVLNGTSTSVDGVANASASSGVGQAATSGGKLAVVSPASTAAGYVGPAAATAEIPRGPEHAEASAKPVAAATGAAGGSKGAVNDGALPQKSHPDGSNGSPAGSASSPDLRLIAGATASLMLAVGLILLAAAAVARRRRANGR